MRCAKAKSPATKACIIEKSLGDKSTRLESKLHECWLSSTSENV